MCWLRKKYQKFHKRIFSTKNVEIIDFERVLLIFRAIYQRIELRHQIEHQILYKKSYSKVRKSKILKKKSEKTRTPRLMCRRLAGKPHVTEIECFDLGFVFLMHELVGKNSLGIYVAAFCFDLIFHFPYI